MPELPKPVLPADASSPSRELKLFMVLLGSKASGRHVEQHDYFFGIARSLKELLPEMKAFWREAGSSLHVDGWREVAVVDSHRVKIVTRTSAQVPRQDGRLFFINLGGYQEGRFSEQHFTVLTVKENREQAFGAAKNTSFFKQNSFTGSGSYKASAHIDDRYALDVDDLYEITEILAPPQKELYAIELIPGNDLPEDLLHLGYFKVNDL